MNQVQELLSATSWLCASFLGAGEHHFEDDRWHFDSKALGGRVNAPADLKAFDESKFSAESAEIQQLCKVFNKVLSLSDDYLAAPWLSESELRAEAGEVVELTYEQKSKFSEVDSTLSELHELNNSLGHLREQ